MDPLKSRPRFFRRTPSPQSHFLHDDEDEFPTPRIVPKLITSTDPTFKPFSATSAPAETPAARLRALLSRESRSLKSMSPVVPPVPSSEADSDTGPSHVGSSTSSIARGSLKDIFSRALRDPGDTPQKGRPRRNSFDGSSMEITPVVDRARGQRRRTTRRSLSDEEAENSKSIRRSHSPFRLSATVNFDNLRSRLVSSQSQLMDQNLQEALYDQPSLPSTSTSHHLQASSSSHPARTTTTTPHPSFQISSQLASHSNLLEQDSEMQRAMGDVLNSENEASMSAPNATYSNAVPFDARPSSYGGLKHSPTPEPRRTNYELDSSVTSSSPNGRIDGEHHSREEDRNHRREREWNRPRFPSGSSTQDVYRRHSQEFHRRLSQDLRPRSHSKSFSHESASQSTAAELTHRPLERRGSVASLRSFDDDHGSRPSSNGSQADYRDRISELERERNHEREREWNKRHPPSRPSSSLSTSSNNSYSHSHPPQSPSAIPYLTPTHASLQRKPSRTSLRSDSPASLVSSRESLKEREQEENKEISHERERNWNSPRPQWSISKSPTGSQFKIGNKSGNSFRAASSLTRLGDSNGYEDISRVSTKPQSVSSEVPVTSPGRLDSGANESATGHIQSSSTNGSSPGKIPAAASKFGWNFARSPLPPIELDDPADHRKSTSSPTLTRVSETNTSSHIPVRSRMKSFLSVGHATSDMSLTHVVGDESSFQQGYQIRVDGPRSHEAPPATRPSWSREDIVLASDEEPVGDLPPESTTPRGIPPKSIPEETETDTETEVLTSPSPGSPSLGESASIPNKVTSLKANDLPLPKTPNVTQEQSSISVTPPGTPPPGGTETQLPTSEMSPSFALITPQRQTSFGGSTLEFRTPSPPHDLPDLPAPPSSSDDDALSGTPIKDERVNSNFTLTKTPRPPGAWAATPLPPKFGHRSSSPVVPFPLESTPPVSTSTPLPRTNTYPHAAAETVTYNPGEDGLLTPIGTLSRARSLPLRTPALPGAWMATPGQSALLGNGTDQSQFGSLGRKKGALKVRFDVAESETSATEGHSNSPLSAIKLINPELPPSNPTTENGSEVVGIFQSTASIPHRPTTPERPVTPISRENGPSPRSLRKSPAVRLVDAYGRERVDEQRNANTLADLSNGHADGERKTSISPPTPRRSLVRIVDAMGREVDNAVEIPEDRTNGMLEVNVSVVSDDNPVGHAETLARMRRTLKDLAESFNDNDRTEDLELNSGHLEQLEEVSRAARVARNKLAHNLQLETAKQHDLQLTNSKYIAWTRGVLPGPIQKPWNTVIVYCGVAIQLLLVLAMWRYAHAEARRLFYTTYYDPLYPEFTPIQGSSCFSGTLPTSPSWTLLDSYETIRREGWLSIRTEMLRALRHVGDQAWERWGEHAHFEKPT